MRNFIPDRMPEDVDAERALLSTCCGLGGRFHADDCSALLTPEDFVHPSHRAVFVAMVGLLESDQEINLLTLRERLEASKELGRMGGIPGLVDILAADDVERPKALAKRLIMLRQYRDAIHAGARLVREAAAQEAPPAELLASTVDRLVDIGEEAQPNGGLREVGEDVDAVVHEIEEVAEGRSVPGVSTGLTKLDWMLGGGWKPGQMIVLAARPGIGKSTLAQQFALKQCERGLAAFWSLEMSRKELLLRIASSRCGIHSNALATGQLTRDDWARLRQAMDEIKRLPLLVDDRATTNVPLMRGSYDRSMARKGHIGLGVVDYLQLVKNPSSSAATRQNESVRVGEISRDLKLFAKDRSIPLLVLSQMNREVEHRNAARPQLSDLRDSGAIEQDADVVLFIHRHSVPAADGAVADLSAELIVAKNRNGPTGIVRLVQDLSKFRFVEQTHETSAPPPHDAAQDPWGGYQD